MARTSKLVTQLWEAHLSRECPHNRPASELGSAGVGDLIELDAYVAGYISRIVGGEQLTPVDLQHLAQASLRIGHLVEAMSGDPRDYFLALAQLAELAGRCPSR